jgi:hypothetical protein
MIARDAAGRNFRLRVDSADDEPALGNSDSQLAQ